MLIGAGSAVSLQSRFAATDLAEPQHRARSLALVVWVGTLGSVLGPNLGVPGEIIGAATGLTVLASAFLVAAVCLALAGTIIFVRLRPDPLLPLGRAPARPNDPGVSGTHSRRCARTGVPLRSPPALSWWRRASRSSRSSPSRSSYH
ncbi:hypothetical protein APR04_004905 [Promicromonospora umidemergens]|uniref:MFS transporter n=1 Tax=Promicromonospora umidemergens TaxID=629679 RepID=A0ABP8WDM8_9MICO|nr:hypothetical protein [Promicromonospora umidemergens]MCP2285969.1 hypothetical protein [Promicromonospora umidemergens]